MIGELLAGIRDSPAYALLGCAAIIPLIVWVVSCVSWMVMGEMSALFGLAAIGCAVLLGIQVMMPSDPAFAPIAFVGIIATMIVFPIVRRHLDRRDRIAIDVEQMEGAYRMLAARPDNVSAMFKLADVLYSRGLVGHAIGIGEKALSQLPKGVFPLEHHALQRWKHVASSSDLARTIPCLDCSRPNGASALYCEGCGAEYLAAYARGQWLGPALAMKLVAAWVAALVALLGLPLTLSAVTVLPLAIALCALQLGLAGFLVWRAFRHREAEPK